MEIAFGQITKYVTIYHNGVLTVGDKQYEFSVVSNEEDSFGPEVTWHDHKPEDTTEIEEEILRQWCELPDEDTEED